MTDKSARDIIAATMRDACGLDFLAMTSDQAADEILAALEAGGFEVCSGWQTNPWPTDGRAFLVCFFGPQTDIVFYDAGEFVDYFHQQKVWQENSFAWRDMPDQKRAVSLWSAASNPKEEGR